MAQDVKARLRIEPLAEVIVFKLYEAHLDDDFPDALTLGELLAQFKTPIPTRLVASSIELLRNQARIDREEPHVRRIGTKGNYTYAISGSGIIWVEQQLANAASLVAYFASHGDEALEDVAGFSSIFLTNGERVVRNQWQPLEIDRGSESFQNALKSIVSTSEIIRGDNGFATEFPDEREGILTSLQQGLELLKKGTPSARQLIDAIINPLKWVASQFAKSVIGTAATETAKTITLYIISLLSH